MKSVFLAKPLNVKNMQLKVPPVDPQSSVSLMGSSGFCRNYYTLQDTHYTDKFLHHRSSTGHFSLVIFSFPLDRANAAQNTQQHCRPSVWETDDWPPHASHLLKRVFVRNTDRPRGITGLTGVNVVWSESGTVSHSRCHRPRC